MIVLKAAQEKLLRALQAVAGIVERRHTLPVLANVLIKKVGNLIEFTASDLEVQIRTSETFEGDSGDFSTTVGARKLIDILRSLPEEQIVCFSSSQNKVTMQGGKSRFILQTLPSDDFPLVQEASDFGPAFTVPQATLKSLIGQVHFAMAVHDIRYYLNGILLVAEGRKLTLVATDGHRLAHAQALLEVEIPKQEVILPRKSVLELQRLLRDDKDGEQKPIEMRFASNQAKFGFNGIDFVTKLVEGKFPDYNRVIPRNHKNHFSIEREKLLASLQRIAILTSEKFKGVRANVEPGLLRIAASNADQEEATEEVDIEYKGENIEIGFNVTYIIDVLTNMSDCNTFTVQLHDGNSSALLTVADDPGFKYVVMPMRI
ncbi:MAG: DNA polymerase III subunit beta [Burkholderiaceae bacterium]